MNQDEVLISVLSCFFQLLLEVSNVPDLLAGVSCSFGSLAEVEGHVNGNRVMCLSPTAKEIPLIPADQGTSWWGA